MESRSLYMIVFGIVGFFISLGVAFVVAGTTAGFVWLFIVGDGSDPYNLIGTLLTIIGALGGVSFFVFSLIFGYKFGKKRAIVTETDKRWFYASLSLLGVALFLLLVVILTAEDPVKCEQDSDCINQGRCINKKYIDQDPNNLISCGVDSADAVYGGKFVIFLANVLVINVK